MLVFSFAKDGLYIILNDYLLVILIGPDLIIEFMILWYFNWRIGFLMYILNKRFMLIWIEIG